MDAAKAKSLILFTVITVAMFYVANMLARTPEEMDPEDQSRSQVFIDLVSRLSSIDFDLTFVDSVLGNLITTNVQGVEQKPSTIGRVNPFSKHGSVRQSQSAVIASPGGFDFNLRNSAVLGEQEELEDSEETAPEVVLPEGEEGTSSSTDT